MKLRCSGTQEEVVVLLEDVDKKRPTQTLKSCAGARML